MAQTRFAWRAAKTGAAIILASLASTGILPPAFARDNEGLKAARAMQAAFAQVAKEALPAVVVVKVGNPPENPDLAAIREQTIRRILGLPTPDSEAEGPGSTGMGSGAIISREGHVVTNHHVIAGRRNIRIVLSDGRELDADLVGSDPKTDLAVLRIRSRESFPFLRFADPSTIQVGHWAIAVGAPLRLEHTVTVGVVSHVGRAMGMNAYENYVQTDAAINLGNSGGPLLNIDGEIIGIVDFILAPGESRGNIGLSFAISSGLAKEVCDQLIADGVVIRPWVGISMKSVQRPLPGGGSAAAVAIAEVVLGDPADKAGLLPGDVILSVDGAAPAEPKDVQTAILRRRPGDTILFRVDREGKNLEIPVVAGRQRPDRMAGEPPQGAVRGGSPADSALARLGIRLGQSGRSVVIKAVEPGSVAALAGLRPGMTVHAINQQPVENLADAEAAARDGMEGGQTLLSVSQGGTRRFVVLGGF